MITFKLCKHTLINRKQKNQWIAGILNQGALRLSWSPEVLLVSDISHSLASLTKNAVFWRSTDPLLQRISWKKRGDQISAL